MRSIAFRGSLTDRSGSITAGGTAQQLMAANTSRTYFFLQNTSAGDLWLCWTGTASAASPSIQVPSGASYETSAAAISTQALSIYGANTGQTWTANEG